MSTMNDFENSFEALIFSSYPGPDQKNDAKIGVREPS